MLSVLFFSIWECITKVSKTHTLFVQSFCKLFLIKFHVTYTTKFFPGLKIWMYIFDLGIRSFFLLGHSFSGNNMIVYIHTYIHACIPKQYLFLQFHRGDHKIGQFFSMNFSGKLWFNYSDCIIWRYRPSCEYYIKFSSKNSQSWLKLQIIRQQERKYHK
jgi:hypothetical protein